MNKKFDYDNTEIASSYDAGRSLDAETIECWLSAVGKRVGRERVGRIVDLGCGTGRFLLPLSHWFDADVIGLDPSASMYAKARRVSDLNDRLHVIKGGIEAYPDRDNTCDIVFLSMTYHHLPDPRSILRSARKILRPDGLLAIRTATKESIGTLEWMTFFPDARSREIRRMPTRKEIIETVTAVDFDSVSVDQIEQFFCRTYHESLEKLSTRSLSVFHLISDEQFAAGLGRYRRFCEARWELSPPKEQFILLTARA